MCTINDALLIAAAAGIIAAIAAIGVAIALNNSFCLAPGSPASMVVAGFATLGAVVALRLLAADIAAYFECMGSPAACAGALSNALAAVNALAVVLGIQATACFVAAGIAWIPWAGAAPMYVILGALIIQLALIPSIYVFLGSLFSCAKSEAAEPAVGPIVAVASIIALASIGLTGYVRRRVPWKWQAPRK